MIKKATLVVRFQFAAAHRLPMHDGACANRHGHTWRGELEVEAPVDETIGMAMDFSDLKRVVDGVVAKEVTLWESDRCGVRVRVP